MLMSVYAIEATCHAPSFEGIYEEIYRCLKPGGVVSCCETYSRVGHADVSSVCMSGS